MEKVLIGELDLFAGQKIPYIFDYGDEWRFQVTVEDIRLGETRRRGAVITKEKGIAPEQYG